MRAQQKRTRLILSPAPTPQLCPELHPKPSAILSPEPSVTGDQQQGTYLYKSPVEHHLQPAPLEARHPDCLPGVHAEAAGLVLEECQGGHRVVVALEGDLAERLAAGHLHGAKERMLV